MDLGIRLLSVVIWPVAIGIAVFSFRHHFAALLPNLRKVDLPMMSLELAPPRGIREGRATQFTGEGASGASVPVGAEAFFEQVAGSAAAVQFWREDIYLLHAATRLEQQDSAGRPWYAIRIWVEADAESILDRCRRVSYKLHETFPRQIMATEQRGRDFELWIRVWGEFSVLAYLECDGEPPVLLSRYLELPGRPPD